MLKPGGVFGAVVWTSFELLPFAGAIMASSKRARIVFFVMLNVYVFVPFGLLQVHSVFDASVSRAELPWPGNSTAAGQLTRRAADHPPRRALRRRGLARRRTLRRWPASELTQRCARLQREAFRQRTQRALARRRGSGAALACAH